MIKEMQKAQLHTTAYILDAHISFCNPAFLSDFVTASKSLLSDVLASENMRYRINASSLPSFHHLSNTLCKKLTSRDVEKQKDKCIFCLFCSVSGL